MVGTGSERGLQRADKWLWHFQASLTLGKFEKRLPRIELETQKNAQKKARNSKFKNLLKQPSEKILSLLERHSLYSRRGKAHGNHDLFIHYLLTRKDQHDKFEQFLLPAYRRWPGS